MTTKVAEVDGRRILFTNPEALLWPDEQIGNVFRRRLGEDRIERNGFRDRRRNGSGRRFGDGPIHELSVRKCRVCQT